MAMCKCSECGSDVSDKAPACVKCGSPIKAVSAQELAGDVVTIQQTSKKYKTEQIVAVIFICFGVVACSVQSPTGSALLWTIGVVLYFHSRFGSWWNNG